MHTYCKLTNFYERGQACDARQEDGADDDVVTVWARHAVRTCIT